MIFKKTVLKSEKCDPYYSSETKATHIRYEFVGVYRRKSHPEGCGYGFSFSVDAVWEVDGDADDEGRPVDCSHYEFALKISGQALQFFEEHPNYLRLFDTAKDIDDFEYEFEESFKEFSQPEQVKHAEGCELGDNYKDCPACKENERG